jgi:hypothetical protein
MNTGQLTLALTFALFMAAPGNAQDTNAQCAGLSGAAYGQCTAAVSVQCDGSATQPAGCEKIEQRFTAITGEPVPWIPAGTCPCYTADSLTAHINGILTAELNVAWDYAIAFHLNDPTHDVLSLGFDSNPGIRLFAQIANSLNPPELDGSYGRCGIEDGFGWHEYQSFFSSAEAHACWSILGHVAEKLQLPHQDFH